MTGERDFSELSPQELNAELRAIFELLPTPDLLGDLFSEDPEKSETGRELMRDRNHSELNAILASRLRQVLAFSHLSPGLQDILQGGFDNLFFLGTGEDVYDDPYWGLVLNVEGTGIFDQGQAAEIARSLIRHSISERLKNSERDENIYQQAFGKKRPVIKGDDLVFKARQEFIEKYGDEP
ncbi:hypothetical protein A2870_04305 [Candidatus Curtissbacteria bacterium RIFCSPHIGHO2_01_FULL_41_11]|uniref:Uncharacterized protein n=1 Tax=Candidatus Curtissbacteria bacterium RIFCSPHIGHO2_01_FULL_41_11 TaxID=1797711 RepID=A0A1F5G574_9BACT|nr:MAG: hypothetical protein A2870_04305 [Candidatus Curtissbacteria bacterium RIFCSPHIGHO2_01_FULL_41_11]